MLTPMLFVKDLARMEHFYSETFGLRRDSAASEPSLVVLIDDHSRLALHELPAAVAARVEVADPPEPRTEAALKLIFSVEDLPAAVDTFAQLGGQLFDTMMDDTHDGADPEGNVLRITA